MSLYLSIKNKTESISITYETFLNSFIPLVTVSLFPSGKHYVSLLINSKGNFQVHAAPCN